MDIAEIESKIRQSELGSAYDTVSLFSAASWAHKLHLVIWSAHTRIYRIFPVSPRVYFCADGPGAGKSLHLELALALASKPCKLDYVSQASFYSYLDEHPDTTYGVDEADKKFGTDGRKTSHPILASVINGGYRSSGTVMVMRNRKAVLMPVYTPVGIAGIGTLPEDTLTRCIVIDLRKGTPEVEYLPELHEAALADIGAEMGEWLATEDAYGFIESYRDKSTDIGPTPRYRGMMAPMLAVADYAGIGDIFRLAANEVLTGISQNPPRSQAAILLDDVRSIWPEASDMLNSTEIITALRRHPSGRWQSLTLDRVGQTRVAHLMRQRGIETRVTGGARGYTRRDVCPEAGDLDAEAKRAS